MKVGSLCSGYGGLEMALEAAFGEIDLRFVSDIDKNSSKVLAYHHPNVPNLGDLTKVQWEKQDEIDVLCAGYPCQPFSVAGLRKGLSDDRAIFTYIAECISVLRPRYVLLENVAGHLTLGGISVLSTITEMGYYAKWGVVRASDSGATHKRARLFIWCEIENSSIYKECNSKTEKSERRWEIRPPRPIGEIVTNACSERYGERENNRGMGDSSSQVESEAQQQRSRQEPEHRVGETQTPTDSDNSRLKGLWSKRGLEEENRETRTFHSFGPYEPAIRRWEQVIDRPAPIPVDEIGVRPVFVEWMMGLPAGYITNKDLNLSRSAALKMLGNGVCPQQAHLALQILTGSY